MTSPSDPFLVFLREARQFFPGDPVIPKLAVTGEFTKLGAYLSLKARERMPPEELKELMRKDRDAGDKVLEYEAHCDRLYQTWRSLSYERLRRVIEERNEARKPRDVRQSNKHQRSRSPNGFANRNFGQATAHRKDRPIPA